MFNLSISLIIIIFGIALIFTSIFGKYKLSSIIMKKNIENKKNINKYIKCERTIDGITGVSIVILALLCIVNLLKGKDMWVTGMLVCLLNKIFIYGFKKKYGIID